jgi:formylglycine-generating enzyme required for sulfatase activity
VNRVLIITSNLKGPKPGEQIYAVDDNAASSRCGEGDPPPDGCIYVGMKLIRGLSDDALAGVLSHELGHLEKGHIGSDLLKTAVGVFRNSPSLCMSNQKLLVTLITCGIGLGLSYTAYNVAVEEAGIDRDIEREADQAAWDRLADSGYCAGRVMKTTFAELSKLVPQGGKGDIFSTHPSYSERWANADPACGKLPPASPAPVEEARVRPPEAPKDEMPKRIEEARARLPEAPKELTREIAGKDGVPMVLVPAGEFLFRDNNNRLSLPAFYMDLYEVTTSRYAAFMQATGHSKPGYWEEVRPASDGELPVIGVGWDDADAYCRWAGKRLPTDRDWEKAARGTDGRKYPWGNTEPTAGLANYNQGICLLFCNVYADKLKPVNSYKDGRSPYGIYNMAGNVWEWVEEKAIRGGGWTYGVSRLRSTSRLGYDPTYVINNYVGFRCAQDAR